MFFYKTNSDGSVDGYTTNYQIARQNGWTETSATCPVTETETTTKDAQIASLQSQLEEVSTALDYMLMGSDE